MTSRTLKRTFGGNSDSVWSVKISPDGRLVASGAEDARVIFWELDAEKQRGEIRAPGRVYAVAFSPDGKRIATAGSSGGFLVHGGEGVTPAPIKPLLPLNQWGVP